MKALHPAVVEYMARFDAVAGLIPVSRRQALRQEVVDHLADAVPASLSDVDAELILAGFGNPRDIIEQEMEGSTAVEAMPKKVRHFWALSALALVVTAIALAFAIPLLLGDGLAAVDAKPGSGHPFNVVTAQPDGASRVFDGRAYEEYRATIATLGALPEGAEWPDGVPEGLDVGRSEGGGIMQAGAGANVAQFTYLCAWEAEYISAEQANDAKRLTAALSTLEDFAEGPFMSAVSPDGGWKQNVISALTFADSSGLRLDFPGTCQGAGIHNVDRSMRDHASSD